MKDRYLFKAKSLKDGSWEIGYFVKNQEWAYIVKPLENGQFEFITVNLKTVCRCAGIRDKNGTLVFENDIVKCGNKLTVKVNREFARWWAKGKIEEYIYRCCKKTCCESEIEVIGNIFDDKRTESEDC